MILDWIWHCGSGVRASGKHICKQLTFESDCVLDNIIVSGLSLGWWLWYCVKVEDDMLKVLDVKYQ